MKTVLTIAARILGAAFALVVFGLMISLTYSALGRIFPDNLTNQLMGVALFDIGAAVSLLSFVYVSKGGAQRAISLLLFVISLIGTLALVALEVMLSNGTVTSAEAARPLAYAFIAMTAVHLVGVYAHHISAPDTILEINLQSEEDATLEQAITDTQQIMSEKRRAMASAISKRQQADIYRRLSLLPPPDVIDALVRDAETPHPTPAPIPTPPLFTRTNGGWTMTRKEAATSAAPFASNSGAPAPTAADDSRPNPTAPGIAQTAHAGNPPTARASDDNP